ncbi:putative hydrolase of the HAD superfamily [Nicoletella semolina]|uniref:Putative hydrolase of the HAD superfamily n=1 Tax=Nicoletella semolina TaxID=271160 RepID=A0A4R2NCP9_9PAST|nr:pyrimidine 5'-nucleotidase [Nicoletella semolina]MDH2924125.1 dUMP phosphatase [Nicoletella semolina]TCP18979.1 putative hydrolase of the HAD superfamily [Nicoletella semolina]
MKYQWILFDADETLFSFHSYLGLKNVLSRYGISHSKEDYAQFQAINKPLWVAYQNAEISAEELRSIRFAHFSTLTGRTPLELNLELMNEMAQISQPLDGVYRMLESLHGKVKMGIITNGFTYLQHKRLTNTNTEKFFEFVITSEEIGVAKPSPQIFEAAFSKMGEFDRNNVLMVGDTLTSDIQGGRNMGIDTCWFNPTKQENTTEIAPHYEIHSMSELVYLVSGRI